MSVVGPRPALPNEVATYNDYQRQRLLVKPGMTCYWQTRRNRDSITFDEWVDLDLWCGLGYLGYLSERLWKAVRPFWKSALFIEDDSDFGVEGTRRVRKLYLWASIQHDDRAHGRELFDFCANDPQTASSAVCVLAEWVLRLSGDLSEKEWDEWVHSEIELLLDREREFRKRSMSSWPLDESSKC